MSAKFDTYMERKEKEDAEKHERHIDKIVEEIGSLKMREVAEYILKERSKNLRMGLEMGMVAERILANVGKLD